WGLSEEDLFASLPREAHDTRFLGYYTPHGVELVLEASGIFDRLRDLSYEQPFLELDLARSGEHTVRVWGSRDRRELLVELRRRHLRRPGRCHGRAPARRRHAPGREWWSRGRRRHGLPLAADGDGAGGERRARAVVRRAGVRAPPWRGPRRTVVRGAVRRTRC